MRIVVVSHEFPHPPDKGNRVVSWNIASELAARHQVTLLTRSPEADGRRPETRFNILAVPRMSRKSRAFSRFRRWSLVLLHGLPSSVIQAQADMRPLLREIVSRGDIDVIIAAHDQAGWSALESYTVPVVVVKHSVQARDVDEEMRRRRFALRRQLQGYLVKSLERQIVRAAGLLVTFTDDDRRELAARYEKTASTIVVSVGSSVNPSYRRASDEKAADPICAFVGYYGWHANVDAVRWLVEEIWPRIRSQVSSVRLYLIGRDLPRQVLPANATSEGIEYLGFVPELANTLNGVAVGLVPVRLGTGMRCKVADFMACGVPVVATPLGARGIPGGPGDGFMIADSAEAFAGSVVLLLGNEEYRRQQAERAVVTAERLTWRESVRQMEEAIEQIISRYVGTRLSR